MVSNAEEPTPNECQPQEQPEGTAKNLRLTSPATIWWEQCGTNHMVEFSTLSSHPA